MVTIEHPDQNLKKGICQAGTTRLQRYLMDKFHLGNSGCFNPNSVLTSGLPSFHTTGQAGDLTADYNNTIQRNNANAAFDWLYNYRDSLNLQQIIFGHRIWSSFDQVVRQYIHQDHLNHLHFSLGRYASLAWSTGWILGPGVSETTHQTAPSAVPMEEDEVSSDFFYPVDGQYHRLYGHKGNIMHFHGNQSGADCDNLTKLFAKQGTPIGPIDDTWEITGQIRPNSLGKWIDCTAIAPVSGYVVYFQYEYQGKGWHLIKSQAPAAA